MEDPTKPIDVPVPTDFGPVTSVEITVVTTRDGEEQPPPTTVDVVIKGCLESMYDEVWLN